MDMKDFKTAGLLTMLVMLVIYAPDWLNRQPSESGYSAPWIYPSAQPISK